MENSIKVNFTKKPYVKPEVTVHGAVEEVTLVLSSQPPQDLAN